MKQRFSQIIYIFAALFLGLSCNSTTKIEAKYDNDKSKLSEQIFEKLDYQVKSFNEAIPDEWRKEQFQTVWTKSYQVKRRTFVKEQANTFPRYTVVEEFYETENSAAKRLGRIHEKPPNLPIEQQEYWIVTGFKYQKNVYFIQTDSVLFSYYMSDFTDKLSQEINKP